MPLSRRLSRTASQLISKLRSSTSSSSTAETTKPNGVATETPAPAQDKPTETPSAPAATMSSPVIKLNSGYDMPQVGFGLWKVDNATCADTIYNAIKVGYRLFDGACDYGNEKECGDGITRAIKDGLVKREDLFIVSKLWQTFHEKERVEPITRRQLADWQIDYFDLFLIHFPVALEYVDPEVAYPPGWHCNEKNEVRWSKATNQETWEAMEDLVAKGLTRSIGVSNYQAQTLYDTLKYAKIRPATLQIELHPYLQQVELVKLAKEEGIAVTAYSTFGPSSFIECDIGTAQVATPLLQHDDIKTMAENHGKTPAQILLRWATQRGLAVIPKTNRPEVMAQNLDCTGFDLTQEENDRIAKLELNLKFNKPTNYFTSEKVWIFG
jgi:D-xylose reductase